MSGRPGNGVRVQTTQRRSLALRGGELVRCLILPPSFLLFFFLFLHSRTPLLSVFLSLASLLFFLMGLCFFLYPSFSGALFQGDFFDLPLLKYPHPVPAFTSFSSRANPQSMLLKRKLYFESCRSRHILQGPPGQEGEIGAEEPGKELGQAGREGMGHGP